MKNLLLVIFVALTLIGTLCAGSSSGFAAANAETIFMDQGSFVSPWCASGDPGGTNVPVSASGNKAPKSVCSLGKNCNNDELQLRAGDGAPRPVCAPNKNCNNDEEKKVLAT